MKYSCSTLYHLNNLTINRTLKLYLLINSFHSGYIFSVLQKRVFPLEFCNNYINKDMNFYYNNL